MARMFFNGTRYFDCSASKSAPNKYNIQPCNIRGLHVRDWDRLKEKTWKNTAMKSGTWWCHVENDGMKNSYDSTCEFWIGFNEDNEKVDYQFSDKDGVFSYKFNHFYDVREIKNKAQMMVQVNALKWINEMIDEGILGI